MKKAALLAAALLALAAAGGASAYALKTVTVAPTAVGKSFSGDGDLTLAPLTIPAHGVTAHWTSQPDSDGFNLFQVVGSSGTNLVDIDNGNSTTSGQSYIPPGTYTLQVTASAAWTLSF